MKTIVRKVFIVGIVIILHAAVSAQHKKPAETVAIQGALRTESSEPLAGVTLP